LKAIRTGQQKYWVSKTHRTNNDELVIVSVPINILSPAKGINVPKALAVIIFSLEHISLDVGTIGVIFFEAFSTAIFLGLIFIYIVNRFTRHPLQVLNDDMDSALRGDIPEVPVKYKFIELEKLIHTINAALSRIPDLQHSKENEVIEATDNEQAIIDSILAPLQYLVTTSTIPRLYTDAEGKLRAMSSSFEELSGIHFDSANGESVSEAGRDEAFGAMMVDLMEKAPSLGLEGVGEEYEFGSGLHKMHCLAVHSLPEKIEGFLFTAESLEGDEAYG